MQDKTACTNINGIFSNGKVINHLRSGGRRYRAPNTMLLNVRVGYVQICPVPTLLSCLTSENLLKQDIDLEWGEAERCKMLVVFLCVSLIGDDMMYNGAAFLEALLYRFVVISSMEV